MEGSMETEREGKNAAITAIRRWARVLTVISVIFAGLLWLVASAEGTPGNSMGPLAAIWFGLSGIYAVAMCLALKWERAAVPVAVAALLAAHVDGLFLGLFEYPGHALVNGVVNPFLLVFWVPVLLYLLCWRLEGRARRKAVL
jgi:hypothetical protein